jgi:hypothetical protein
MVDRVTIAVPELYMKVQGQWLEVLSGSQVDVPSASAFAANQISNVQAGTGSLLNGTHAQPSPGGPFRSR